MKKREFRHTSLENRETVVHYLQALAEGLKKGSLRVAVDEQELVLEPRGLLRLDLRVSRKHDKQQVKLEVSWNLDEGAPSGALRIEPQAG